MEVQHIFLVNQNWKDINPMECGQERCAPGHSFGPGVRDYYILHYVLSGVGRFTVNGTAYTLHAGDIFVIRPFERIYYEADAEAPWHYVWVGFEASVPLPEALSQDVIRCPDARAVFLEMLEAGKLEQGRERCLCGRIWLLLSMLEHMESAGPRGSDYVLRAVNWMQTNYMNPVSISALAGELNLDRSYFSTLFRRQTGRSCGWRRRGRCCWSTATGPARLRRPWATRIFSAFRVCSSGTTASARARSAGRQKTRVSGIEKSPPGDTAGWALSIFAGAALNTGSSSRRRIRGRWSRAGRTAYQAAAARARPA